MQRVNKMYHTLFAIMTVIFVSLDSKYSIPGDTILRWILPALMLGAILLQNNTLMLPKLPLYIPMLVLFFATTFRSMDIVYSISRFISLFLMTLTFYNYFKALKNVEEMFVSLKIMGVVLLIYELLNIIFLDWAGGEDRAQGITGNPNSLGVFSNVAFLFALLFFLFSDKNWKKWLCILFMLMSTITAIASGSRTYTVSILINIFFATQLILKKKTRVYFWLIFIAIIILGFSFFQDLLLRLPGINRLIEVGADRGLIWTAGLKLVRQKPIFGWGYGISAKLNTKQYLGYIKDYGDYGLAFHNSYLTILIETGIVGLMLILFMVGAIFIQGIIFAKKSKDKRIKIIVMLVFIMLLCFYGCSAMNSVGSTEGFVFWASIIWLQVFMNKYSQGDAQILHDYLKISSSKQRGNIK